MHKNKDETPSMALYETILTLSSVEDCYHFFQDLCSVKELRAMEQRFNVARLRHEGKVYTEIIQETGVSSATVNRVSRALENGSGGLFKTLENL